MHTGSGRQKSVLVRWIAIGRALGDSRYLKIVAVGSKFDGLHGVPVQGWLDLILAVPIDRMAEIGPYLFAMAYLLKSPHALLQLTRSPL
jgi:hypothetical protein